MGRGRGHGSGVKIDINRIQVFSDEFVCVVWAKSSCNCGSFGYTRDKRCRRRCRRKERKYTITQPPLRPRLSDEIGQQGRFVVFRDERFSSS